MVSYLNDAALLTKTIKESKINSLLCGGAGGFTHKKFINEAGVFADNLLTATLWTQQLQYPGTKEYYDQYAKHIPYHPTIMGPKPIPPCSWQQMF